MSVFYGPIHKRVAEMVGDQLIKEFEMSLEEESMRTMTDRVLIMGGRSSHLRDVTFEVKEAERMVLEIMRELARDNFPENVQVQSHRARARLKFRDLMSNFGIDTYGLVAEFGDPFRIPDWDLG